MKTVILEHEYAAPAKEVWALATDLDALKEIMKGVATSAVFHGSLGM